MQGLIEEKMADKATKKRRSYALSIFTRTSNALKTLMDEAAPLTLVTPMNEKKCQSWEKLENKQEEFIEASEIDVEEDPDGLQYLIEPDSRKQAALVRYARYLKHQEEVEAEDRVQEVEIEERKGKNEAEEERNKDEEGKTAKISLLKSEFFGDVGSFKGLAKIMRGVMMEMSIVTRQTEGDKLSQEFKRLKNLRMEILQLNPLADHTSINNALEEAEDAFLETKGLFLADRRDEMRSSTSGGSGPSASSTKKEAVKLPSFKGDEKSSPYLHYSVWRKQWDVLIDEYEAKWRSGLLWDHLDSAARSRYIGYETDYEEAMGKLEKYYGDPQKVINSVMREVMAQPLINQGEYKNLVSYCTLLENNFNRLKNLDLQHEMSNTSTMFSIVRKFPTMVAERWNEYLCGLDVSIKRKPFEAFINWLKIQRETWERMSASEMGRKKTDTTRTAGGAFYGDDSKGIGNRACFVCGKEGHMKASCPTRGATRQSKKDDKRERGGQRRATVYKRYWCALHKGDEKRGCWSSSCQELKKLDVKRRINLLRENKDCQYCCGDHKSEDCFRKERKCGGGRENRGCTKDHNLHELFCPDAKLCFSVQDAKVMAANGKEEGVVLSVMKVNGERKREYDSVFWDLGCTSNFVRAAHAEHRGFRGRKENLSVTTLGGSVTDYSVTMYNCSMRDEEGQLYKFEAYGIECITGPMKQIDLRTIKRLFPHLAEREVNKLGRLQEVDYLIGMKHASWHPERAEKSKFGGDLWIYRGKFGACVGGRQPEIKEVSSKSKALFTVNYVYHSSVLRSTEHSESHEFEFCANRGISNLNKSAAGEARIPDDSSSFVGEVKYAAGEARSVDSRSSTFGVGVSVACVFEVVGEKTDCFVTKTALLSKENLFFDSETLGTIVEPKCGGCLCTKCPIPGSKYSFQEKREFDVISRNDDTKLSQLLSASCRYQIVKHVTSLFCQMWSSEVAPGLVTRQKWHERMRNLTPGDLVMICEATKIKGKHRLAVVEEVKKSGDVVRSATLRYSIRDDSAGVNTRGGIGVVNSVRVSRSIQRLALIMPVEEQEGPLEVYENSLTVNVSNSVGNP